MRKHHNTELFSAVPVPRALLEMAAPTVFSQIIILIYNLADTFFVGRTGDPYMVAGASLILPVFNICLSLASLAGVGGGSLIARLLGEQREAEARRVSAFCFWFSVAVTALFSAGMGVFMSPVLRLLGAGDNTFRFARQYAACVIVLGGIPTVLSNVMANLLRSVGFSKAAGFGVTMGGVINIALDPLFMFVLLPKGSEMLGAGIATLLSNCLSCAYLVFVILRARESTPLTFSPKAGIPEKKSVASIFNVGLPSAVATLLFDIDYVIIDRLMAAYGDIALAAVGIVLKAERLPLNVGVGICQGMLPLAAYNFASGDTPRMKRVIRCSLLTGLTVGAVSVALYEVFAGHIMRVFIADAGTVALGTDFLRVRVLATPLMFASFFTVYVFQSFGEGNISLFLGVTRWLAFNIPMLFILNAVFGMYGVVWSQVSADALTVLLSAFVYVRYMRSGKFGRTRNEPAV